MKRETILTVASWAAVIVLMAFICFKLVDQFAPEYPEPSARYTESAFKSLQYQNAENQVRRLRAERFIESLSNGRIK